MSSRKTGWAVGVLLIGSTAFACKHNPQYEGEHAKATPPAEQAKQPEPPLADTPRDIGRTEADRDTRAAQPALESDLRKSGDVETPLLEGRLAARELTGDSTVRFIGKSDQNLIGMAAFTSMDGATRFVVDVGGARKGDYEIVLRDDGKCDEVAPESGKRVSILGHLKIGEDGHGHLEATLSKQQMNDQNATSIASYSLVLQEATGIAACGLVAVPPMDRPAS